MSRKTCRSKILKNLYVHVVHLPGKASMQGRAWCVTNERCLTPSLPVTTISCWAAFLHGHQARKQMFNVKSLKGRVLLCFAIQAHTGSCCRSQEPICWLVHTAACTHVHVSPLVAGQVHKSRFKNF